MAADILGDDQVHFPADLLVGARGCGHIIDLPVNQFGVYAFRKGVDFFKCMHTRSSGISGQGFSDDGHEGAVA